VYEKTPVTTARRVISQWYDLLRSMVHTLHALVHLAWVALSLAYEHAKSMAEQPEVAASGR
jgi:hypothetical protein